MSWTKRQFIAQAYEEIGYASYQYDLDPEQLQDAMSTMDSMVATWYTKGIQLGYPIPSSPENSDLDEETSVPDSANEAIYLNLAIRLAPSLGKMVMPETKLAAKAAYDAIAANNAIPQEQQITGLPRGAGSKYWIDNGDPMLDKANTDPLQIEEGGDLGFIGD